MVQLVLGPNRAVYSLAPLSPLMPRACERASKEAKLPGFMEMLAGVRPIALAIPISVLLRLWNWPKGIFS
jgi:hypothetical protein